jgi:TolA-binding protein
MTGNPSGERRCPDDLMARGQREPLNELERHALAAHLSQCGECRAAAALSALFDAVPDSQPGDDDLIARVADRALRKPRRPARFTGLRVAAVVALVILTGGGATAALVAYRRSSEKPAAPQGVTPPSPAREARRTRVLPKLSEESPAEIPAAEPAHQPEPVAEPAHKHRLTTPAAPAPALTVAEEPTAASLFAEANAVRRRGDTRQAITLYQHLRQRFPASSQATLSAISEGDLLLGQGDAAAAVVAYSAYLRDAPQGSLTEEALYGRARGLRMQGRSAEERQTWEELVRRFPKSAYQPTASRRLRELAP